MRFFYEWAVRLTILSLIICHAQGGAILNVENKKLIHKGIHKRGLFYPVLLYPYNACSGILVAIAIPLNIPNRSVFVSYNFEANYNMPNQPGDSFPGPIQRFPGLKPEDTSVNTAADVSPDDVSLGKSFSQIKATNSSDEVSEILNKFTNDSSTEYSIKKREASEVLRESAVFTRKGIYRLLESRLDA